MSGSGEGEVNLMISDANAANISMHDNGRDEAGGRKQFLTITLLVGLALLVRIAIVCISDRVIKWDEPDYLRLGINLWSGKGFTTMGSPETHYTPFFPVVVGLAYFLVRDLEFASELVHIICGALLVIPIYTLAKRIYGYRVAFFAALMLAVFPALTTSVLYWGTMSEPLFILLIYLGLSLVFRIVNGDGERDKLWFYALAGVCFSLAYLTRPEGVTWAALALVFILLVKVLERRFFLERAWLGLLLFSCLFILVALPYMVYLHHHTGRWTVTGKLGITYDIGQAVIDKDPAEYDRVTASLDSEGKEIIWFSKERYERRESLLRIILNDPEAFLHRIAFNVKTLKGKLFARTAFSLYLLIPVFIGLFVLPWSRRRLKCEAFLFVCAAPTLVFLPFHVELRFFSPIFPVLLIWTANGLVWLGDWLAATLLNLLSGSHEGQPAEPRREPRWVRLVRIAPALLVVLYLMAMQPLALRDGRRVTNTASRVVGLWLRDHTDPGAVIMARDLSIAVYAERPWVPSPHAEYELYISYARSHHVDYLIVDEWELTVLRPQLNMLLNTAQPPKEVELVYTHEGVRGKTLVYRLKSGS